MDVSKGAAVFANFPPTMRASMAKDLAAGRPFGAGRHRRTGIAGRGALRGVPTPTTKSLVGMIEAAEKRGPGEAIPHSFQ